ncbi:MAG TPA: hypothetical protein VF593_07925 [Chthoniobacteraceae bacterium]
MSRPPRLLCTVVLLAVSLAVTGCGTIYTRMYSPRRSYYKAPPEKAVDAATLLPPEGTPAAGAGGSITPSPSPTAPAPAPTMEAAPVVPGLPM